MEKLLTGLNHFRSHIFESHKELFERLAHGQTPDALFITCSDSRINPNMITQTMPGDLFILRNAGNIVPPYGAAPGGGEAGTIEFAVAALGIKDIIICGHSACGAIKGLLDPDSLEELPLVKQWLSHADATRRIVKDNYKDVEGERLLSVAIQENVLVQIENLKTHPVVAAGLSRGTLRLHGWSYKIQTGEVFSYSSEQGQFLPISEVKMADENRAERPRLAGVTI